MSIDQRIVEATKQLEKDVELTHEIVNGDDTTEVMTAGGPVPSHAKVAKDSHDEIIGQLKPTVSSINELASFVSNKATEADTSADRAKTSADRADEIAGLETVRDALRLAAVPLPDFCLPLNDNLMILEGVGTPYQEGLPLYHADFTRSTTKTYISKSGELKIAQINEPAFEQSGILIEGSSTNLIERSTVISGNGNNCTGSVIGDLCGNNVTQFTSTAQVSGDTEIYRDILVTPADIGTAYTFSVFINKSETSISEIRLRLAYSITSEIRINMDSGLSSESGVSIKNLDNYYRVSITRTCTSLHENKKVLFRVQTGYAEIGDTFTISCPQVEKLPLASSYIATNGSPVTRAADSLSIKRKNNLPGNLFPVTFAYTIACSHTESIRPFRTSGSPAIGTGPTGSSGSTIRAFVYESPPATVEVSSGSANNGTQVMVWNDNRLSFYLNGNRLIDGVAIGQAGKEITDQVIHIGRGASTSHEVLFGNIKNFCIWNSPITHEQIAALG